MELPRDNIMYKTTIVSVPFTYHHMIALIPHSSLGLKNNSCVALKKNWNVGLVCHFFLFISVTPNLTVP